MSFLTTLAVSLFFSTAPIQKNPSYEMRPLSDIEKATLEFHMIEELDNEIEMLFKLAFYAYQDGEYEAMIDIFDILDKHMRLRDMSCSIHEKRKR